MRSCVFKLLFVFILSTFLLNSHVTCKSSQESESDRERLTIRQDEYALRLLAEAFDEEARLSGSDRSWEVANAAWNALRRQKRSLRGHTFDTSAYRSKSFTERSPHETPEKADIDVAAFSRHLLGLLSQTHEPVEPGPVENAADFPGLFDKGVTPYRITKLVKTDLSKQVANEAQGYRWPDSDAEMKRVPLHWVITTCNRTMWARHLVSTMLNGLLMGVRPTTMTVLMCDHMPKDRLPTVLHNLRYSHHIKFVFLPESITKTRITNYMLSLSMPFYLGKPDLPLLVTEDDVVFTADFNRKLHDVTQRLQQEVGDKPYMLNLYEGQAPDYERDTMLVVQDYRSGARQKKGYSGRPTQFGLIHGMHAFWFGTQGMLFSPAMYHHLLQHFLQVKSGQHDKFPDGPMDLVVHDFMERFQCFFNVKCAAYRVTPSMVEHIGVSSSCFGGINNKSRFHMSTDFPFKVEFPAMDPKDQWRRRGRRA
mmetsp:Transcript_30748/g.68124  ORF Transcript_30748/g.68124 Transcript_30748/m.68124 type:complete len:479 (+) Transcript_30748:58-1494(+)